MHISVLQKEVIEYLQPDRNDNFVDATFGLGGHTMAIVSKIKPEGKVLALEKDPELYKRAKKVIPKEVILVNDSHVNLEKIVFEKRFKNISGVLFDLGVSTWHLESSGRGFSFKRNEPLDMRFDPRYGFAAEKIVNYYSKQMIEKILKDFGEEKKADKIAQKIVEARKIRPIKTTLQLVNILKMAGVFSPQKTFQALRIAVNNELSNLSAALSQALGVIKSGGRLVVISFHSLEDRIVKEFFQDNLKKQCLKILTKKPIRPSAYEIRINPNSRSARMRVALKI